MVVGKIASVHEDLHPVQILMLVFLCAVFWRFCQSVRSGLNPDFPDDLQYRFPPHFDPRQVRTFGRWMDQLNLDFEQSKVHLS